MYKEYPYTTYFHDIDDMCECLKEIGYRLEVQADSLKLVDSKGEVISTVKIHYSDTALTDIDGKGIKNYLYEASTGEKTLVLTKGDGNITSLTIPFATSAAEDTDGKALSSYAYNFQISGNKVQLVKGDGTIVEYTIPFATKAATDINNKDLTTYAATLVVDGDNLVLKDSLNRELARLTPNYALRAFADDDGDAIDATYATRLTTGVTTIELKAKDGTVLSSVNVPWAQKAVEDTDGNDFLSDYAEKIVVDGDGKRIGLEAHDGTRLATITVPFATLATNATNAIQTVAIQGDQIVFTTFGGQSFAVTAPYAIKSERDSLNNVISQTYVANIINNEDTGELILKNATGATIATLAPVVTKATYDSYGNLIADYIKDIVVDNQSNYILVSHGNGTTDSLLINYSVTAWKDTNGNVIKNTYVKRLAIVDDIEDGHFMLVAYNGDTPEAELFRVAIPELEVAPGGGLVINRHKISLSDEVKEHLYDFTVNEPEETFNIDEHELTE